MKEELRVGLELEFARRLGLKAVHWLWEWLDTSMLSLWMRLFMKCCSFVNRDIVLIFDHAIPRNLPQLQFRVEELW